MAGTIKGRNLLLEIFDGGVWKEIGGIRTKDLSRDNPVADATSQGTTGNETEASYTGFSTITINGNGVVRTDVTATLVAYKTLAALANSASPIATLRFSDAQESHEGDFLITSFSKSGEHNGILEFTAAFQNAGPITYV